MIHHFLDSGAFTLIGRSIEFAKKTSKSRWDFYRTKDAKAYLDEYAEFLKSNMGAIDLYANVDAIGHAELTWRNQQYLEQKHGLRPVPVVHKGSNIDWIDHYIDRGHDLIGIGGMVGKSKSSGFIEWLDKVFDKICDNKDRLPSVKLHGFGVTSVNLITRYPWWSIDNAGWCKSAGNGTIFVPQWRKEEWKFTEPPYTIDVSEKCIRPNHIYNMTANVKSIVTKWLDFIGVALAIGKEKGIDTCYKQRFIANMRYFKCLEKSMPEYPWPFPKMCYKGFDL